MADGAPMSDERARIPMDVHPAGQSSAYPRDQEPTAVRLRPAKSLSATGATWAISTGRNGNPTYSRPSAGYPDDREISQHLGFTSMALLSSARASA